MATLLEIAGKNLSVLADCYRYENLHFGFMEFDYNSVNPVSIDRNHPDYKYVEREIDLYIDCLFVALGLEFPGCPVAMESA